MLTDGSILRRARQRSDGFTLVELLIAIAAMGFVLIYTLGTFTANRNTYVVIDNVSEAHQNTLAIAGLIERDIRNAGYMVPPAAAACGVDSTSKPDVLYVSDTDAVQTYPTLRIEVRKGDLAAKLAGAPSWGATTTVTLDKVTIDMEDTYDTNMTPGADSDFRPNSGVIVTNLDDPTQGVYCGTVQSVNASSNQIVIKFDPTWDPPGTGPPSGSLGEWAFVPANVYWISGGALRRNDKVMARNVEDLQLSWFYDTDADGERDNGEDLGKAGTLLDPTSLPDPALLREIRFNLVVKTAEDDPKNLDAAGTGQARENRTGSVPAPDGRRRRVHTTTVRLRNVS